MKYVHNRQNWKLILEARDNRNKIKKFFNNDELINWAHELDNNYSIWIVNTFKDELIKELEGEGAFKKDRTDGNVWTKGDVLRLLKQGNDVDEEKESKQDRKLNQVITLYIERLMNRLGPKYRYVIDWTNGRMRDAQVRENLKGLSLKEAWDKSDEWHKALAEGEHIIHDEEGEIIMTFKDDFYWIDLQTDSCSSEGKAMGHCGNTTYGTTLFSLRKNKKPFVTIAFNEDDRTITQAKGRANEKPIDKYHPYIVDLLINPKVNIEGFDYEYHPQDDFQIGDLDDELFYKLYKGNKQIFENTKGHTTLVLLNRGLIDKKEATKGITDIVYDDENEDLYITFSGWEDLAEIVFKDSHNRSTQEFAKNILSHDYHESLWFDGTEKFDFSMYWYYLTIDTLNILKGKIISEQDGTFYDDEGDEREFTFTEENLIVDKYSEVYKKTHGGKEDARGSIKDSKNIGGMYFEMDGEIFDMSDILEENRDNGWIEDIVDLFNNAASESNRWSIEEKWFELISEIAIDKITDNSDKNDKTRYKFFGDDLGLKLNPSYILSLMDGDEEGESFNYNSIEDILKYMDNDEFTVDYVREDIWGDISDNIDETLSNVLQY